MNGELNPGKACAFRVEGNPRGPTLVFIHGWPDDASLWRRQVTALGDDFRCVLVTLPAANPGLLLRVALEATVALLGAAAAPFDDDEDDALGVRRGVGFDPAVRFVRGLKTSSE